MTTLTARPALIGSMESVARPGQSPIPRLLIAGLLSSVLMSGFINLIPSPFSGVYVATLVSDIIVGLMMASLAARVIRRGGAVKVQGWVLSIALLILAYIALVPFGPESLQLQLAEIRTRVGYLIGAVYVYAFVRERRQQEQIINYATFLAVIVALIGVAQQLRGSELPAWLIAAPGEIAFSYQGTEILRANGLVGNTIVFAALMLMFMSLSLARALSKPGWIHLGLTLLFGGAVVASYSRMAIVLIPVVVMSVAALLSLGRQSASRLASPVVWSVLVALVVVLGAMASGSADEFIESSFLASGLFDGANASVVGSTDRHFYQIAFAADAFLSSPLVGVGIGTQRMDSSWFATQPVITDGAIWLVLAEGGLVVAIPTAVLLIACGLVLWRGRKAANLPWLPVGLAAFYAVQLLPASLLNSAILGKAVVVTGAVLFGLAATQTCTSSGHDYPTDKRASVQSASISSVRGHRYSGNRRVLETGPRSGGAGRLSSRSSVLDPSSWKGLSL